MNNIETAKGEIVMYQPDETIRLEVRVEDESVWLTQQQITDLFNRDRTVIKAQSEKPVENILVFAKELVPLHP